MQPSAIGDDVSELANDSGFRGCCGVTDCGVPRASAKESVLLPPAIGGVAGGSCEDRFGGGANGNGGMTGIDAAAAKPTEPPSAALLVTGVKSSFGDEVPAAEPASVLAELVAAKFAEQNAAAAAAATAAVLDWATPPAASVSLDSKPLKTAPSCAKRETTACKACFSLAFSASSARCLSKQAATSSVSRSVFSLCLACKFASIACPRFQSSSAFSATFLSTSLSTMSWMLCSTAWWS
mmetsp:Transcript_88680/g.228721  ORF Transcript_88680/g.228721 Transcript_88680/m.228721 type:complete len:238 (+) Transcript_88680:534-1247(+)